MPAAAAGDNGDYKTTKDYKDSIHKDIDSKSETQTSIWAKTTSATGMMVASRQTKASR